ncbi:hypothetical protein CAEBREN_22346 [Caenorhabditis brenneri]|uniref:Uncharacterized protein n=1 Tax=Caenorhabditis brenneri TaxID=135651 RepID=G0N3D0_CAEBE|nr:hypothetical protein CAEBREN_22346 [Caenorhabditis brenneri]
MGPNKPRVVLLLLVLSIVSTVYGRVNEQDEDLVSSKKILHGGTVGAAQNAARYLIKNGGTRAYNGLNIYDTAYKTAKGDPKWFARIDYATAKNPVTHLNVNKAITGLRDPHIKISGMTARAAGLTGGALNVVQKVAPIAMAASMVYDAVEVLDDWGRGNGKLAAKKSVTKTGQYFGASYGASGGAAYGTAIFPGIGTLIGGIIGGIGGGLLGGAGGEALANLFI